MATTFGISLNYKASAEEVGPISDKLCYTTIHIKVDPNTGNPYDFGDQDATGLFNDLESYAASLMQYFTSGADDANGNNTHHYFEVKYYYSPMDAYKQKFELTEPVSPKITSNPGAHTGDDVDSKSQRWKIKLASDMSITIDYGRVVNR